MCEGSNCSTRRRTLRFSSLPSAIYDELLMTSAWHWHTHFHCIFCLKRRWGEMEEARKKGGKQAEGKDKNKVSKRQGGISKWPVWCRETVLTAHCPVLSALLCVHVRTLNMEMIVIKYRIRKLYWTLEGKFFAAAQSGTDINKHKTNRYTEVYRLSPHTSTGHCQSRAGALQHQKCINMHD